MVKKFSLPEFGYEVVLGKFADQANGAAWFCQGGTVVLSTAVSAASKDFPGFFPLTVDYREQFAAAGKIPGGYYKREGKFSDKEVLVGRLIDRSIRPLFPANFFDQVQVLSTVYSVDKEHTPYCLALLATSIALCTSDIPFMEPVGAVEICRLDGKWIVCPTFSQTQKADVNITVAGTYDGICMVEGSANEISETEFLDALFLAHEKIKKQVEWQQSIVKDLNVEKQPIVDPLDWNVWEARARAVLTDEAIKDFCSKSKKVERSDATRALKEKFFESHKDSFEALKISSTYLDYIFDVAMKEALTNYILKTNKRVDQRDFNQVRKVTTEVGLLPYNHGSALFHRGGTQALVSVTLGGGDDEQRVEDLMGDDDRTFMLHYNFPAFSVGDVRPNRGPGRREVGHGYLAAAAIKQVLPHKDKFPYTIRVVSDILSSDGSSSMATVCGSTMALMHAGVPIQKMVGGVAMGLLMGDNNRFQVLTDIAGIEDAFGMMDFKVAGTTDGITAIQMDIKHKGGLERKVFEQALSQAKEGRLFILGEMSKVMSEPNKKLSELVPQVFTLKVPTDKIGAIIGSQGKVIKEIIEKTGTKIDIEDDGSVKIYGHPGEKTEQAIAWVKTLAGHIEKNTRYSGKVKRFADFGLFVEIAPGTDGLVHISTIPKDKQQVLAKTLKIDDIVVVEVMDYEESTGRIRLKLID